MTIEEETNGEARLRGRTIYDKRTAFRRLLLWVVLMVNIYTSISLHVHIFAQTFNLYLIVLSILYYNLI